LRKMLEVAMQSLSEARLDTSDDSEGTWPIRRRKILDWLVNETRSERFIDNIFVDMCWRLSQAGVPVARATLHFRIHHPQLVGARILWRAGLSEAEIDTFGYGVEDTAQYLNSPLREIDDGAKEVRRHLGDPTTDGTEYPLYDAGSPNTSPGRSSIRLASGTSSPSRVTGRVVSARRTSRSLPTSCRRWRSSARFG
jgi:adenylate cyclase